MESIIKLCFLYGGQINFLLGGVGPALGDLIKEEISPLELGKILRLISIEANIPNHLLMYKSKVLILF